MGINTKLRLIDAKFEQVSGGTLTFGGDNTIAASGSLEYASDPSGSFIDNSIVNKKYVDDSIIASATTANNGLTKANGNITLGGILTGNTVIDNYSSYNFRIENTFNNNTAQFNDDNTFLGYELGSLYSYYTVDYNNNTIDMGDFTNNYYIHNDAQISASNAIYDINLQSTGGSVGLNFHTANGIKFTDSIASKGAVYAADYSANFTDRSLVDKGYVTGLTSQAILTASNGLTKVGQNVVLGGALTGSTTINGASSYGLSFSNLTNFTLGSSGLVSIATTGTGDITIDSADNLLLKGATDAIIDAPVNAALLVNQPTGSVPLAIATTGYVTGLTSQGILTANNGLTKSGTNVTLGGTLTGATAIDGGYALDLGQTTPLTSFDVTTSNNINLTTSGAFAMNINTGGQLVVTSANGAGACFAGDYSSSYNNCSIVDKKYIDDQIVANAVTANSGLAKSASGNITLGGALTGSTSVVLTTVNDFSLNDASFNTQFYINADGISLDHLDACMVLDGTAGNELIDIRTADAALNLKTGVASTLDFSSGFTITDNAITKVGLVYAADYKATFNNCSLVSKEYVDGATGSLSASNGLTRVEDDIILGGGLTGDTTISSASHDSCLIISSPMIANDVHNVTFHEDATFTDSVEGRLYYQNCALNFDREISGVTLQLGEETVIRVTNITGTQIDNGAAVYGDTVSGGLPTVVKSIATDDVNAMKTVGLVTHDLANNNEGYIVTQGVAHNVNTGAYSSGQILWLSTTVAGGYTNVRPTYPDSQVMLGRVLNVGTSDGSIYVKPLYIPPYTDYGLFTGYTASTQTDLDSKLDTTIFNGYSATTDGRLDIVEIVTDIAITGATNGLTKVPDHDVKLGGAMTESTTINGAQILTLAPSNNLILKTTGDYPINLDSQNSGSISLKSQSGSLATATSFTDAVGIFADFDQVGGFAVYDNRAGTNQTGIVYAADYSSDYVNRSLVDKAYVDSVATGLQAKAAVVVTTTDTDGNIDISGGTFVSGTTIDGIVVDDGWRVLIKNQTDGKQNGVFVYSASTSGFTRAEDYDGAPTGEVNNGDLIPVITGDSWTSTQWILTTSDPVVIGTDDLDFSLFSQLLQIGEGDGIDITSIAGVQTISVELATNPGLEFVGTGLSVADEIAGSGLTWNTGVLGVNACSVAPTGTEISVRYGTGNNLYVDGDDFSYTTASNGLTKVGCFVTLGGVLTGNTVVDGSTGTYSLGLDDLNDFTVGFETATITDNGGAPSGLLYAADYSAGFDPRSLVDREYVDSAITGDTHLTYDNGLTKHGDIVSWGGTLTGDTAILYNTANLCFLNGACSQVQMIADCSCSYVDATNIHINTCNSSGCISKFDMSNDGSLSIVANNAATGLTITSAGVGAVYAADYSGTYVSRSLVDKAYVDGATGSLSASNGLTRVGDNITLGGTLTGTTCIEGLQNLYIGTNGDEIANLSVNASFGIVLYGNYNGSGVSSLTVSDDIYLVSNDVLLLNAAADKTCLTNAPTGAVTNAVATVGYVDGIGSSGLTSANNGLTKVGQNVVLGGTLTGDTTLDGASSYGLTLNNLTDFNVTFADSVITDTNTTPAGLIYAADYSSNFAPRSLVDKGYVTGLTTTSGIQTANNGLTKVGTNVVLGGTLTGDTNIDGAFDLILGQPTALAGFGITSFAPTITASSGNMNMVVTNGTFNVTMSAASARGITYAADYSANFVPRSLVDKGYVTGLTTTSGVQTANNGLTKIGTNAVLGGALTGDTEITGAFDLTLNNTTLNISGATLLASTLGVTGAATLASTLDVTGAATLESTLDVSGATSLASTLSLDATPADGSISDSVLVWDSADKVVKKVSGSELGDPNNIYDTTTITTSTTLTTGSTYVIFVNHSAAVTVTLPPTPIDGQVFKIKDVTGNALTNNITVSGNGNNIDGAATGLINTDHGAFELIFNTTLDAWFSLSFIN